MNQKIIARGAEAVIFKHKKVAIKTRITKGYRLPQLDEKLRKLRTRAEAKLLQKAHSIINTPKLITLNESTKTLNLEYISGKKLASCLEKENKSHISKQIGKSLARLHDANIIHGDLTTSNMILHKAKKVYFIDFGLGFHSPRLEDKAVDLHVLKEALQAKHPTISQNVWKNILNAYVKTSPKSKQILKQLSKVELRGRYKAQY